MSTFCDQLYCGRRKFVENVPVFPEYKPSLRASSIVPIKVKERAFFDFLLVRPRKRGKWYQE